MSMNRVILLTVLFTLTCSLFGADITGEKRKWHRVSLTFDGPSKSETSSDNPFRNYRLDVTFTHSSGHKIILPGFFAADGNAANSGAVSGNKWRVHFRPDKTGTWSYKASFRKGTDVAIADSSTAGKSAGFFDGESGSFSISNTNKSGLDFRGKGRLKYVGEHYLRHENGEWFIKVGPDSPEGFLANHDFDVEDPKGTRSEFKEHGKHWKSGDPTWKGGKGKNIIGAVNYISDQSMNCFYILTYTAHGDTRSVWPYKTMDDRYRFDCSKLDQWEIVFQHMDKKGILNHLVFSETENETYWEKKDFGVNDGFAPSRKLYYRELIARFGHHLGVVWNLGEELGWNDSKGGDLGKAVTSSQLKQFSSYIRKIDAYNSMINFHTLPGGGWNHYEPMLGFKDFEGISGQFPLGTNGMSKAHDRLKLWIDKSRKAGRKWVICNDEPGGENIPLKYDSKGNRLDTAGVRPDKLDSSHNYPRNHALWGSLMAGSAGVETYFGWNYTSYGGGDGKVNNFDAWRNWWKQCRIAKNFFKDHLEFWEMKHDDDLTSAGNDYVFAKRGSTYAVYLPSGGTTSLNLGGYSGSFEVKWFDPRNGGSLQNGSVTKVNGNGTRALGNPPNNTGKDWVILVRKTASENKSPSLSFATPSNGDVLAEGANLYVKANASDSDGSIANVKLYLNGVFLREEKNIPYEWGASGQNDAALTNMSAGNYTLKLVAEDNDGATASKQISITVEEPNKAPSLNFATPANGATFKEGKNLYVKVNASDSDGSIANVKLFLNNNLVRQENLDPYEWGASGQNDSVLKNMAAGSYTLKAVATDNKGKTKTASIKVNIEKDSALPSKWSVKQFGDSSFTAEHSDGVYTLSAAGTDIWGQSDEFGFAHQDWDGDLTIVCKVNSLTNTHSWAKAGIMIRETLAANSAHVMLVVTPGNGVSMQYRLNSGESSSSTSVKGVKTPQWLKLTRRGNTVRAYYGNDGGTWIPVGKVNSVMSSSVFAGLALTSHNSGEIATAKFSSVELKDPSNELSAVRYVLVNASTGKDIKELFQNDEIDLASINAPINIRVEMSEKPGSVRFFLNGTFFHNENGAPYYLNGNDSNTIFPWNPAVGSYTLDSIPYSQSNGGGLAGEKFRVKLNIKE